MKTRRRNTSSTGRKVVRFAHRKDGELTPLPKCEDPGPALSGAITKACKRNAEPGVWEVMEYEDVIYRVHLLDTDRFDVRVETVR